MSKQKPLFPDEPADPALATLTIRGSAPSLNLGQKQFNRLIAEIASLRKRLVEWQDYPPRYQQRVTKKIEPAMASLREARIHMVGLLDEAILGKGLNRREREQAGEWLHNLVMGLRAEADDAGLAAIAARHGFDDEDEALDEMALFETLGEEMFGIELGEGHGATTPDELAQKFAEKLAADAAAREAPPKLRRKSAKAQEREALAERAASDAGQALREVYRKLARDLHPDRIADDAERARKTALMQDANRAYEARDLLTLLELQWRIEQIDPQHIADLAEERLAHFNHVLKEQVQSLREEIDQQAFTYALHFQYGPPRDPHPDHVDRELDREARDLQQTLRALRDDVRRYANLADLKRDLKQDASMPPDEGFDALLGVLMDAMPAPRRKPGRRR